MRGFGAAGAIVLALAVSACSSDGGSVAPAHATPGAITFTSSAIEGSTIFVECPTGGYNGAMFTVSQPNYSGTFTLTVATNSFGITVTPTSGTSATTFTLTGTSPNPTTSSVMVAGGGGQTATLPINYFCT